jgi:pimeloyl-ACP methyl ester carboxylesterase
MLAYRVDGDGPEDLVLLHAGVADMRMWDPLVERLAGEFRILRCDLPGFGDSPEPEGRFSTRALVAEVCKEAGLEAPIVVGNSYGGFVALGLSEIASQLVLLSAFWPLEEWSAAHQAFGAREEELIEAGDIEAAVELNVELWAPAGFEELIRTSQRRAFELQIGREPDDTDEPPDLDAITIPVVAAFGDRDVPDFIQIAETLSETIEGAILVKIEDSGHLAPLERPDAVADLIRTASDMSIL